MLRNVGTQNKPSHIINIGSIAGLNNDSINAFAYGTSKAAIHHLSGVLAKELVKEHINVNAIAPGSFPSKMMAAYLKDEKVKEAMLAAIPMGRMGEPEDIGNLIIYLCSSSYMTGTVLTIDGGTNL